MSPAINAQEYAGLGVSDLNIVATIKEKETKQFEVGKVYNTGDFNMTITNTWVPNEVSDGVNVAVIPEQVFLHPGEDEMICVRVQGWKAGNYSGKVSFSCDVHLPPTYVGNPTVPSGEVNAKFVVTPKAPSLTILVVAVAIVFAIGLSTFGVWKHKKRRAHN